MHHTPEKSSKTEIRFLSAPFASRQCWGGGNETDHNNGQLGQGNTWNIGVAAGQMGDELPPVDLGTGRTVVALAVGWYHT